MMKRLRNIYFTIFIVAFSLFSVIGCDESKPQEKKGSLNISVLLQSRAVESLLQPSISYIIIEGTGPDNTSFSLRVETPLDTTYTTTISDLKQGLWSLEANAFNNEGKVIGNGKSGVYVSETTSEAKIIIDFTLGYLTVSLNGSSDKTIIYTAHILKKVGYQFKEIASNPLTGEKELISAIFILEMGDYYVQITSSNENIFLPEMEFISIGKNPSAIQHDIQDGPEFSKNPKVEISINSNQPIVAKRYQASVTCYNINNPTYSWFLNDTKLEQNTKSIDLFFDVDGDYVLKCIISDDSSNTWEKELDLTVLPTTEKRIVINFYDGENLVESRIAWSNSDQNFPFVEQKNSLALGGWVLKDTGDKFKTSAAFSLPYSENEYSFEIIWENLDDYFLISDDGEISKIGDGIKDTYIENLVIPSVFKSKTVTSIGKSAFSDCANLVSIEIPETVTFIGQNAFDGCSSLYDINIPSNLHSIEDYVFCHCESLTSITIPQGTTSIGNHSFMYCSKLSKIEIPSSVITIGSHAFSSCESLSSIVIPDSVSSIESGTFNCCKSLVNISLPSSVETIKSYAFANCSSLETIEIPDSVTSGIESYTFYSCRNLSKITIGNSVTSIEKNAFYGCSSLEYIDIPNSVTTIKEFAFLGCRNLSTVKIGNGIKYIDSKAFDGNHFDSNCYNLSEIFIDKIKNSLDGVPWGAENATVKWRGEF